MKLSVLVPMYNAEHFIIRCLDSLMSQKVSKDIYEVVVFDDGSTDKSLEIVNDFSKKHYNILVHSHKNQGVVATRNKLLKLAKGEYIFFVDADDYVVQNSLNTVLHFAIKNKLDIIGFDVLVTSDDKVLNFDNVSLDFSTIKIVDGIKFLKENKDLRVEVWWYFVKKEFLNNIEVSFKNKGYDDDLGFTLSLFLQAKRVAYCSTIVYRYFQSPESTMRSKALKHKKRIADYFLALIVDLTNIINGLDNKPIVHKDTIKSNFLSKRDMFTFFTVIKIIRAQFNLDDAKKKIETLQSIGAYPIINFVGETQKFKYKVLVTIFNKKSLLFTIIKIYNIFR